MHLSDFKQSAGRILGNQHYNVRKDALMPTSTMRICLIAVVLMVSAPIFAAATAELQQEVADTERAFARTMAIRDYEAFISFLAPDAIFFSPGKVLHGKNEVATAWKRFYQGAAAPFSWDPDQVEVLDSGDLALSTGLVRDAHGKLIGRFNSIWRREGQGKWRVVFDKGDAPCECSSQ
jgi:ketosteroid isomerase-like protein